MKLNDLDCLQAELVNNSPDTAYCWNCVYLNEGSDGNNDCGCYHPENVNIKGIVVGLSDARIDYLIYLYLAANGLEDEETSDFGVGSYCSKYEYYL